MEFSALLLLTAVVGSILSLGDAIVTSSGDGPTTSSTDFSFFNVGDGSGDDDPEYSGNSDPEKLRCSSDTLWCWCVNDDGSEMSGTRRAYAQKPDCDLSTVIRTTTEAGLPTRPTIRTTEPQLLLGNMATEVRVTVTEEELIFIDDNENIEDNSTRNGEMPRAPVIAAPREPQPPVVLVSSTERPFDNNVPVRTDAPPPKVNINEDLEEETNEVGGADSQVDNDAVQREEPIASGLFITNPGILAAIIGGGVVGLLCAILLVMFIVYRMRKKDEGSYPLNDTKPLKNYAYAKAPSREFYA